MMMKDYDTPLKPELELQEKILSRIDTGIMVIDPSKNTDRLGKTVQIQSLNDITEQKSIQKELTLGEQRLSAAIRHARLQFWEYDMQEQRAYISEFTRQSYGVPKIMEHFPESFLELGLVHEEDREAFRELHRKLNDGVKDITLEYRILDSMQEYHWQLVHYTAGSENVGTPSRAFATAECIDRLKTAEEGFEAAAKMIGARIWAVNMLERTLCFNTSDGGIETGRQFPCRTEEEFGCAVMMAPEDVSESWQAFQELWNGKDSVTFKAHLKTGDKYRWHRVTHTVLRTQGGIPVKGIGVSVDIHEHILLEQRFGQEMEYSSRFEASNLITKVRCNITHGTVDLYTGTDNTSVSRTGAPYEEGVENLAMAAVRPEQQEEIRYLLNRERVQEAYANGENSYEIIYLRRGNDRTVFWAHTVVKTYQEPDSGDLMSFMYTFNIDQQKITESIINRVVDTNFEYLTLFNAHTGMVERAIDKAGSFYRPQEGRTFEEFASFGLRTMLTPEEFEIYYPLFSLKNITEQLIKNGTYSYSFDLTEPGKDGRVHKLWICNWFDEQHTRILCSRSDITEAHRQEQLQREALSAALTAAEHANMAKTDFLSRMSHEIRTPMNAIIGMTAIAAKFIEDSGRVADCLNKIDLSSRFLLSLINDILDMSRIESGKAVLKEEDIVFHDFVKGINTICRTQAEAKGIHYECRLSPSLGDFYIGDAMKLQQVLVNILGNAVKFTDRGGKVALSVEQRNISNDSAVVRFVISDTGIGMSEEFLPHLFMPFEQESAGITSTFGGTGLGLAISKSIVDMMDGRIQVRSQKGLGTEFTIDVRLGIPADLNRERAENQALPAEEYDFSGRRLLLAEDNPLNAEIAQVLLTEAGFTVDLAENGYIAVEMFAKAAPGYYDAILMDIRMPVMDGLQAASHIRRLAKYDAKKILIIAMTADAFDEDAEKCKKAGMNLHMPKPIDPPRLYHVLYCFFEEKR